MKISRAAADVFYARRREGTMSFHPESITAFRGGVEKATQQLRSPKINFPEIFRVRLSHLSIGDIIAHSLSGT